MTLVASIPTDSLLLLIGLGLLCFPRQWLRWGKKRTRKSEKHLKSADKNDFVPNGRRDNGDPAIMDKDEFSKLVLFGFFFRPRDIPMIGAAFLPRFLPVFSSMFSRKQLMLFNRRG